MMVIFYVLRAYVRGMTKLLTVGQPIAVQTIAKAAALAAMVVAHHDGVWSKFKNEWTEAERLEYIHKYGLLSDEGKKRINDHRMQEHMDSKADTGPATHPFTFIKATVGPDGELSFQDSVDVPFNADLQKLVSDLLQSQNHVHDGYGNCFHGDHPYFVTYEAPHVVLRLLTLEQWNNWKDAVDSGASIPRAEFYDIRGNSYLTDHREGFDALNEIAETESRIGPDEYVGFGYRLSEDDVPSEYRYMLDAPSQG